MGGDRAGSPDRNPLGRQPQPRDTGAGIARAWSDQDDVGMVVGLDNSAVALAVEQIARERNRIAIAIAEGANDPGEAAKSCSNWRSCRLSRTRTD